MANSTNQFTKILKFATATIVALIVFISCSDDSVNYQNVLSFSFLKAGNQWTYTAEITDEKSQIFSINYKRRISISSEKDNFYSIDSLETGSIALEPDYDDVDSLRALIRIVGFNPNSLWFANSNYLAMIGDKNLPFPLFFADNEVGNKWELHSNDRELGILYREIISVNETLIVPAGTFTNCIKIKEISEKNPEYYCIYWISKKDGIIKYEEKKYNRYIKKYVIQISELESKNF